MSIGQGILGNNMFAYCLNNPVSYVDGEGTNTEVIQWWTTGMGWLPFVDAALPIGDSIYIGGILLLGAVALAREQDNVPGISYEEAYVAYGPLLLTMMTTMTMMIIMTMMVISAVARKWAKAMERHQAITKPRTNSLKMQQRVFLNLHDGKSISKLVIKVKDITI